MKEELPLRVLTYNPLSLSGADRSEDVVQELRNFDVVGFPGTQRHRGQEALERVCINGRIMIEAGWKKAPGTNRSAGCGLLLGRRFKEKHVVRAWVAPETVAGRGVACRFRSSYVDLLPVVVYFPPKPGSAAQMPSYLGVVKRPIKWVDEILATASVGCTPCIMVDLNDGMGIRLEGGAWQRVETNAVGARGARNERCRGGAGEMMRELLEKHGMAAANTFGDTSDTCYGDGSSSLVDYVCLPEVLVGAMRSAGPLRRLGSRLQLIPDVRVRDHLPVHVVFPYLLHYPDPVLEEARWDMDAMMEAVKRGRGRADFIQLVEVEGATGEGDARRVLRLLQRGADARRSCLLPEEEGGEWGVRGDEEEEDGAAGDEEAGEGEGDPGRRGGEGGRR